MTNSIRQKRIRIKDQELRHYKNELDFSLKGISICKKDKVISEFMYDIFKNKAIRAIKGLENYLNKPQK